MPNHHLTRRTMLKASAAAAAAGSTAGVVSADDTSVESALASAERLGPVDLSGTDTELRTVAPASVPEANDGLGPGSMLFIGQPGGGEAGCTANFVWRDGAGQLYLGAAGHCFLGSDTAAGGTAFEGDGPSLTDRTVRACIDCTFGGASALVGGLRGTVVELGDIVYARQAADDGTEVGFDFGLVEVPPAAEELVDASMPTWGGPTATGAISAGDTLVQYGNGVGTGETVATKSRTGVGTSSDGEAGSWLAALPAAQGDSGSAVQVGQPSESGLAGVEAAGVLTHLTATGTAGTNVEKCVQLAADDAGLGIEVVLGA